MGGGPFDRFQEVSRNFKSDKELDGLASPPVNRDSTAIGPHM